MGSRSTKYIRFSIYTFLPLGIVAGVFVLHLYWKYIPPFWKPTVDYFSFCIHDVFKRRPFEIFLLFAPAILFDTTRYYLTNTLYFFIHLFDVMIHGKIKDRELPGWDGYFPLVSVVVPAYNEGPRLIRTLEAILDSSYPRIEILVVDDCSTDETPRICRKYVREGKIKYLRKETRSGKPGALNYGLVFAKGEIVLHMDGDTAVLRDAISEGIKPFRDPKVGAVSGNIRIVNDRATLATHLQAAELSMIINVQRRWLSYIDSLQIASGAFGFFRRELLVALKGTDPEYGEDLDITLKIRKMGYKVVFRPTSVSLTEMPETFGGIFRQRLRWDRCYIRVNLRKHRNLIDFRRFRFSDFSNQILDFFYNIVLLAVFPVYMLWVALYEPHMALFIIVITYLFYTVMIALQCLIGTCLSDQPLHDSNFIFYAPVLFLYFMYLRIERAFAFWLEFRRSDKFVSGYFPSYIRDQIPKY